MQNRSTRMDSVGCVTPAAVAISGGGSPSPSPETEDTHRPWADSFQADTPWADTPCQSGCLDTPLLSQVHAGIQTPLCHCILGYIPLPHPCEQND